MCSFITACITLGEREFVFTGSDRAKGRFTPDGETMIAGGKIYLDDCVGCHGEPGKPPSAFGTSFFPTAPQFFRVGTTFSESQIFSIAKHGIRRTGMAAQGNTYTDEKLWALTSFIKHLPNLPQSVSEGIQAKK